MILVFSTCKKNLSSQCFDIDIENSLGRCILAKFEPSLCTFVSSSSADRRELGGKKSIPCYFLDLAFGTVQHAKSRGGGLLPLGRHVGICSAGMRKLERTNETMSR